MTTENHNNPREEGFMARVKQVPPEILKEELVEFNLSANALAKALDVLINRITATARM